jgi:SAM-dependent methyltransferase
MSASSKKIADTLRMAVALDREWMKSPAGRGNLARNLPWMPFPLFDFIALIAEALPEISGEKFLDIGSGIGTKMLLAREIFGLDADGLELVPEFAQQAQDLGFDVQREDALEFGSYGDYDLLFFNRPLQDQDLQARLEAKVWADMQPGAVAVCANLLSRPPENWWLVLDDMEIRRGIWSKP